MMGVWQGLTGILEFWQAHYWYHAKQNSVVTSWAFASKLGTQLVL